MDTYTMYGIRVNVCNRCQTKMSHWWMTGQLIERCRQLDAEKDSYFYDSHAGHAPSCAKVEHHHVKVLMLQRDVLTAVTEFLAATEAPKDDEKDGG